MKIGTREISERLPPYIVAEVSCNHMGNLGYAKDLIREAKNAGADAVKFQCYTPDDLTIDCDKPDFIIKDGPWKGRKLYELYSKTQTPLEWFEELFVYARARGITMFCSIFSKSGVDFLEPLNPPAYKIASMEIVDIPLIKYAAKTRKPIIISSGMAGNEEIAEALNSTTRSGGAALLHCISGYPTPVEEANLLQFQENKRFCNVQHGISDHTVGWDVPVAATVLGATLIEKHLMLDARLPDYLPEDFDFSLRPDEFYFMCRSVRKIWQATQLSGRKSEESSRQLRRSLYAVQDIKAGDRFTVENVRSIRPSYGMAPKELPYVLKSLARCDIEAGTALKEGHLIGL